MRPLTRKTPDTRQSALERRVQDLERRYYPIGASTVMPYVWSYFDTTTSLDTAGFHSLGLLAPDANYSGSGAAVAEVQIVGNDPNNETFVISEEGQIYHVGDAALLLITAAVQFNSTFAADAVRLRLDAQFSMYQPLDDGAMQVEKPFTTSMQSAAMSATWCVWHNGGGVGSPSDIQTLNVEVRHNASSSKSATWGSMRVVKLSAAESIDSV